MSDHLVIIGASARAAAFSALRAGLQPWCADLFADADLTARCPVRRVEGPAYPAGFLQIIGAAPSGPWLYTGALENHPKLIAELARSRPLWGNDEEAVGKCRDPFFWSGVLLRAGLPCPAVRHPLDPLGKGRWLFKPLAGAGGVGIRFQAVASRRPHYLQEFVEGEAYSAVYAAFPGQSELLGATRQLVGEDWLHVGPFRYCGSMGPIELPQPLRTSLENQGDALASACGLRGLFGVDFILNDKGPWPVEINPRYTASAEVLEYALGTSAIGWHRQVFQQAGPAIPKDRRDQPGGSSKGGISPRIGKAILFAKQDLAFPAAGPWSTDLRPPFDPWRLPAFADIPAAGSFIRKGQPILTLFARAADLPGCLARLREMAKEIEGTLCRS